MATTNMNIRADVEVKAAAEKLFNELGISLTPAVNLFLRLALSTGGIPLEIKVDKLNEIHVAVIEEGSSQIRDQ